VREQKLVHYISRGSSGKELVSFNKISSSKFVGKNGPKIQPLTMSTEMSNVYYIKAILCFEGI